MTEKRFLVICDGFGEDSDVLIREDIDEWRYTLAPIYEKGEYNKDGIDEIVNRLNELYDGKQYWKQVCHMIEDTYHDLQKKFHNLDIALSKCREENEQLKSDNNRLVNETARIVAEHQGRVLELIDEKIDKCEPIDYARNIEGDVPVFNCETATEIRVLNELKKELRE